MKLSINVKEGSVTVEHYVTDAQSAKELVIVAVEAVINMNLLARKEQEDTKQQIGESLKGLMDAISEHIEKEEDVTEESLEDVPVPQNLCDTLKSKAYSVEIPKRRGRPRKNQ